MAQSRTSLALILLRVIAAACGRAAGAKPPTVAEQYLLAAINQERTSRNLAPSS